MSIANVLIRPQVLERRPTDEGAVAVDLFTGLGSRLLVDFMEGGPASKKIVNASQAGALEFIAKFDPRLQSTRTKLLDWADPYLSIIGDVTNGLGNDKVENLLAVATSLIAMMDKLLEDLHSANIADRLNSLADILEKDLGISWNIFEEFFDSIFDKVTDSLSKDFLQGSQTEEAFNNFLISRQLLKLRRMAKEQLAAMPLPTFNRRAIIRDWQLNLEASNWDETLDAIQDKLKSGPEQFSKILPLLTQSLSVNVSVSLGGGKSTRGVPKPGQYSWYASWFRGEGTGAKDRFDLSSESFAGEIHFTGPLSIKFLENWALITAALEEAGRAVKYGFDLDNGNRVSPALNLGWQASMGVMTLLSYFVEGEEWVDFYSVKNHTAFQKGVPVALTVGGSFEQFPGFFSWLWNNLIHDVGNTFAGMTWPQVIREGLLSLFTLINADDSPNTKNHEKISGITAGSRTGGAYIAALIMGRRERYCSFFSDISWAMLGNLMAGTMITWAFDIIGWLTAGAFSRRLSARYWESEAWTALPLSLIAFYSTWGSFWQENTDGGKFGVKTKILPEGTPEKSETIFNGYPAKATSPYRLPFEPGRLVFCAQAHNGYSGHNFRLSQIYAVDFLLNEGELVLAMREGTVLEYHDDRPNGSDLGLNYIIIKHDTPDPVHDLGENGELISTYARYEHSSPFGIRQAFAAMGIRESQIIGTRVPQGFPLIRVGKRPGFFKFDHLQVQVGGATSDGSLPTIPFVFRDLPGDGVPHYGKYYGSGNTSRLPANLSQLHPGQSTGWVLESGIDFIKLQPTAINLNDAYDGAHLIIWYNLNGSDPWYEYQKVKSYDRKEQKITIEGNWLAGHPPPPQAQYRVGARPFGNAGEFDKHFAYLASRNGGGQAQPFPDGHAVYTLNMSGTYQAPSVSGLIAGGGTAGSSEVHLGAQAQAAGVDHEYNFRHIIIRRAGVLLQYRRIIDYRVEAGVRKIFIDGVWDIDLITSVTPDAFEIGTPSYWQPAALRTLGYFVPDRQQDQYAPGKFRDDKPPVRYQLGSSAGV